ncbi:hypothetical protein HYX02_06350 [Candidatus Woesearchaeota archaeon]|nr:hypothetical protein [Candidatus Woesearchaeota archaeon]
MDNSIKEKIKNHILEHGFLLEEETKTFLELQGWECERNAHFVDQDVPTESREIDIIARNFSWYKNFDPKRILVRFDLIIECKNYKDPIVFFSTNKTREDKEIFFSKELINFFTTHDTVYVPIPESQNKKVISVAEFLKIDKYHHFFNSNLKATNLNLSRVKSDYSFSNIKLYEATILPLIKANDWYRADRKNSVKLFAGNSIHVPFSFIIPILVLGNDFFEAYFENGELKLKKSDYIQFISDYRSKNINGRFQIDIVNKSYFENYLKEKVDVTINKVSEVILNNFQDIDRFSHISN